MNILHKEYMARVFRNAEQSEARGMMRRAWEATEQELKREFGGNRYGNYDSFMAGKSRKPKSGRISRNGLSDSV